MMEKVNSTIGLARTKSDQLVESMAAALAAMKSPPSSGGDGGDQESGGGGGSGGGVGATLSRKTSRRLTGASPGRTGSSRHYGGPAGSHIRKSRSAQLNFTLDDVSNGAALSRASSASLGLSFSFTGFTMPPDDDIPDSQPFSDDDHLHICDS